MIEPIKELIKTRQAEIDLWFVSQWADKTPPLYLSCDLRHSGQKIAVIDTNLFPAGFNNLCNSFSKQTRAQFAEYLKNYYPSAKTIFLYGEEHTRNRFYLENLFHLKSLVESDSITVVAGSLGDHFEGDKLDVKLDDNRTLTLHKITNSGGDLIANQLKADLVISNNDFSAGIPDTFKKSATPVIPTPQLGWHSRRKSNHFGILNTLVENFCSHFGIDPWLMSAMADKVFIPDFDNDETLKMAAAKIDALIDRIKAKYQQYNIQTPPFVYLKSDRGTYGIGVMPLFSGDELLTLNRRQRNKLKSTRAGVTAGDFFVQEGIPTIDTYSGFPIEPVIYGVGKKDIGGFFRVHQEKNEFESLNSPGMSFACLCLHKLDEPHESLFIDCCQKEHLVSSSRLLTRLASLALSIEAQNS